MSEIIGFCNQKGGVGKTTSAINLAASIAVSERKVLLIDLDPQANTTTGIGFNKNEVISSTYDLIVSEKQVEPQKTAVPFLDIIPASPDLVGAEVELVGKEGRERRLKGLLSGYLDKFDYILIDGPPSLGFLAINILTASSKLIIPVQCEYYALEGLSELLKTIDAIKQELNPTLEITGILLTMFDGRNNLAREVEKELRSHFGDLVFQTVIPRSVRLSEAPSYGKPALLYDAKSRGAQSYLQLADEFMKRLPVTQKNQRVLAESERDNKEDQWKERHLAGG